MHLDTQAYLFICLFCELHSLSQSVARFGPLEKRRAIRHDAVTPISNNNDNNNETKGARADTSVQDTKKERKKEGKKEQEEEAIIM